MASSQYSDTPEEIGQQLEPDILAIPAAKQSKAMKEIFAMLTSPLPSVSIEGMLKLNKITNSQSKILRDIYQPKEQPAPNAADVNLIGQSQPTPVGMPGTDGMPNGASYRGNPVDMSGAVNDNINTGERTRFGRSFGKEILGISPLAERNTEPQTEEDIQRLVLEVGSPAQKAAELATMGKASKEPPRKGTLNDVEVGKTADFIGENPYQAFTTLKSLGVYDKTRVRQVLTEKYGLELPPDIVYNEYSKIAPAAAGALSILDLLEKGVGKIKLVDNPLLAQAEAMRKWLTGKSRSEGDITVYMGTRAAQLPVLARALGHVGVLTQQDVDSVLSALPMLNDTEEVAKKKLVALRETIGARKNAYEQYLDSQILINGTPYSEIKAQKAGLKNVTNATPADTQQEKPKVTKNSDVKKVGNKFVVEE